jgi:hypothetical protein
VDRHRFDADPDMPFHFEADPDTDLDPSLSFAHDGKSDFCLLLFTAMSALSSSQVS